MEQTGVCPTCGKCDGSLIMGGIKFFYCEEHKTFWQSRPEPDTRPRGWFAGLWPNQRRQA